MYINPRPDNRFLLVTGPTAQDEYIFDTYEEASKTMQKITYAQKARDAATHMAQAAEELMRLEEIWNDRLYGVGLVNAITDADLQSVGLTQNQLVGLINFAGQLKNFLNNTPIFQGDYMVTLNQTRNDI